MSEPTVPILIDLGKAKKRLVRDLQDGRGRLMSEVRRVMDEVRAGLGDDAAGKRIVPIVVVYKPKRPKSART